MAADVRTSKQENAASPGYAAERDEAVDTHAKGDAEEDDDEEEEDEDEDEPKLKYTKLTGSLTNVYRSGDSTSSSIVAGDKMVLGTHLGNVHVLSLPSLKPLRTYHAHEATVTSISVSPTPAPPSSIAHTIETSGISSPPASVRGIPTSAANNARTARAQQAQPIPNTPNNAIYIATASIDGKVCISSLLDPKDVQLRNFKRPVQAVALSPDYRNDRTYLTAGLAGQLILTVGGKAGVTVEANTNSAAAAAGGWLSGFGLGGDHGKDSVLHSGEGKIGEIKWSLGGKWVCWVNEEGIKIMRSHLKLDSESSEDAWRRIAHAARPTKGGWDDWAGVWKGRAQWVDERKLEKDEDESEVVANGTPIKKKASKVAKLVVGWGNTAWILHVFEGGTNPAGKKQVGSADIVRKLQFEDCIISGMTIFTSNLLAILAYRTKDDDDRPIQQPSSNTSNGSQRKGRHRHTGLAPQLRLIDISDLKSAPEIDVDELSISRFETLSAQDYHLNTLYIPPPPPKSANLKESEKGALEGLWDAAGGKYATRMFSSGASMLSRSSDGEKTSSFQSPPASMVGVATSTAQKKRLDAHPYVTEPGLKLFIQSPYDCVLAVKRGLSDRFEWLVERKMYQQAWELVESHPEVVPASGSIVGDADGSASSPRSTKVQDSLRDFFGDSVTGSSDGGRSNVIEREKKKIGDLWLQQLVSSSQWPEAGRVAGKVLGTSSRWEHWVWTFAQADKFDEITPFIPKSSEAQLPGVVYEVVLGHYVQADPERLKVLLEEWEPSLELYDTGSVIKAVEARLDPGLEDEGVQDGSEEWKMLMECLARLYFADARPQEALRCWIRVQNADAAFRLIREEKLMDMVAAEDVPGLLMLRVSRDLMDHGSLSDLQDASSEATSLLVDEALRGTVLPATVISQLQRKGDRFKPFIFFYLRALWNGSSSQLSSDEPKRQPRRIYDHGIDNAHALVEDHADLAVELFAEYDRSLLLTFLKASSIYSYEKAAALCEQRHYIPELVHILSKTGQTKRALFLIIGELGDVTKAIAFAKDNPDLWDDLLDYSMDKPAFIRGLLEEVGTAIDPIKLVQRIPEGLEIEGLKGGVERLLRDHDIQFSISEGVARVLRGEVSVGMDLLRAGRRKGVRFEVRPEGRRPKEKELEVHDVPTQVEGREGVEGFVPKRKVEKEEVDAEPGCCVGCGEVFLEDEQEPLIGFACGHVYHLSCLLKANPDTSDPKTIERLLSDLHTTEEGAAARLTVGAKVAHAQIIKNVVQGGCRHCRTTEGA